MGRKKTHEEFIKELNKIHGEEVYVPLEEYRGTKTKILIKHSKCGYEWKVIPSNLLQGQGCPKCSEIKRIKKRTKTHCEFTREIFDKHGNDYEVLGKYVNANIKVLVKHKCGYKWETKPSSLLMGFGCPVCANQKIILGINTIWDTDRWMVNLGVSEEDAKKYAHSSGKRIKVKCPYCGREKRIKPYVIYVTKSIGCSCGDGKSYPEKFIMNLLEQLNVNFGTEYSPNWIDNKRYDFYISELNSIVEVHGEQHYKKGFNKLGGRTLKEEQANDKYKKEAALQNEIEHYIELDCSESNLEWIKSSILNSELNDLFDLSNIDWLKCAEFANKNIVKEVCEYWNSRKENETTSDVGKIFKVGRSSIVNYLKKGVKLGWCRYNNREEMKKIGKKNGKLRSKKVETFKDGQSLGVFESCAELERQSEKLFGTKLLKENISSVCRCVRKQYKGFTFKYVVESQK